MERNNQAKLIFSDVLKEHPEFVRLPGPRQAIVYNNRLYGFAVCWGKPYKIRQFYEDYQGWICFDATSGDLFTFDGTLDTFLNKDKSPNRTSSKGVKAFSVYA